MADLTIIPQKQSGQSYTDYLSVLNQHQVSLQAAYNQALSAYAAGVARYNDWASQPNPDWNFIQGTINPDNAVLSQNRDRLKIALDGLKVIIASVKQASDLEKAAAEAVNAQAQANAAVTQSQSTLSAEQQLQLQLAKIEAQKQADANAVKLQQAKQMQVDAAAKKEADEKAAQAKKTTITVIVIVATIFIVGFAIYKSR